MHKTDTEWPTSPVGNDTVNKAALIETVKEPPNVTHAFDV